VPILFLYSHNMDELYLGQLALPLAICVGASVVLWALTSLLLHSVPRAGLLVSPFWVWFFSFGHLRSVVAPWPSHPDLVLLRYLASVARWLNPSPSQRERRGEGGRPRNAPSPLSSPYKLTITHIVLAEQIERRFAASDGLVSPCANGNVAADLECGGSLPL